jgi:uncharacterized iron-regulated protein
MWGSELVISSRCAKLAFGRNSTAAAKLALLAVWGLFVVAGRAEEPARPSMWVDVYRGEPVSYEDVLHDLRSAEVIYLGERHRVERHHELQRQIVADLAELGVPLALALEQMEVPQQPVLDRYVQGKIDFDGLARETNWEQRWHNFQQYRPILEAARQAGAPIRALNARRETIRAVFRRGGIAKLPEEQRRELPENMQLKDPSYEKLLGILLGVHLAATPERMRPMIEAQIARDEHMAEMLTKLLKSREGKGRTVVVLIGAGHVNYGLGVVARVRNRVPQVRDRIIILSESGDVVLTEAEKAASKEIEVTHEQLKAMDRPIADYLHLASPKQPPNP